MLIWLVDIHFILILLYRPKLFANCVVKLQKVLEMLDTAQNMNVF